MARGGLYILIPKAIHRVNLILVWQIVMYRPGKAGILKITLIFKKKCYSSLSCKIFDMSS